MSVRVYTAREGEAFRPVLGPGDLGPLGEGDVLAVGGTPADLSLWAGALGLAVLRGVSVRRLP